MGVALVTGAAGLLGRSVARAFSDAGQEVHAFGHEQLDVTDPIAIQELMRAIRPTFVVHCAALTDVDACEHDGATAWLVNAEGPGYVAAAAGEVGAEVVAVSTDYVFDGEKGSYVETDETNPIQEYGRAKLAGEQRVREANPRHYIVRSAWIYGEGGKNFLSKIPEIVRHGQPIKAITDQRSSPTFAPDLAEAILSLQSSDRYGTYHVTNDGGCSYVEFTKQALEVLGSDLGVEEVTRLDLQRPAPRPGDTSFVCEAWARAGFRPLRAWRDAAEAFLAPVHDA